MENTADPFREHRHRAGVLIGEFQGEEAPMILRHEDVRQAAKDWKTFSSDAPFRVPIPSEEDVRTLFQKCTERLESLTVLEATPHVENEVRYQRVIGYESLTLKMVAL